MAPDAALDFMASLGVVCVPYEVITPEKAEERMDEVRRGYGYEGEVMYFMDARCEWTTYELTAKSLAKAFFFLLTEITSSGC